MTLFLKVDVGKSSRPINLIVEQAGLCGLVTRVLQRGSAFSKSPITQ
jgi:hypothetical protein